MIIVFIRDEDAAAMQYFKFISDIITLPLTIITVKQLIQESSVYIDMDEKSNGQTFFEIKFKDQTIQSKEITKTINLVHLITENDLRHIVPEDRQYVMAEWNSIFLSILTIVKDTNIFNAALPGLLSGRYFNPADKQRLNELAGFSPVDQCSAFFTATFTVFDNMVFGAAPVSDATKEKLLKTGVASGNKLLHVNLAKTSDGCYIQSLHGSTDVSLFTPSFSRHLIQQLN